MLLIYEYNYKQILASLILNCSNHDSQAIIKIPKRSSKLTKKHIEKMCNITMQLSSDSLNSKMLKT